MKQEADVKADLGLEFDDALLRKDMGNNLALASVVGPVAGVEDPTSDGHKGIIKFRFKCTVPVGVDDREGVRVSNGDVVRSYADERS